MPEMEYDDEDELMIILDDAEMQKSGRNEAEPELEALKSRSQSRERPGSRGSQTSQSSRCNEKSVPCGYLLHNIKTIGQYKEQNCLYRQDILQ